MDYILEQGIEVLIGGNEVAYDMECYDEYDGTEGEWEGIVGYGVSAGFKWHF